MARVLVIQGFRDNRLAVCPTCSGVESRPDVADIRTRERCSAPEHRLESLAPTQTGARLAQQMINEQTFSPDPIAGLRAGAGSARGMTGQETADRDWRS